MSDDQEPPARKRDQRTTRAPTKSTGINRALESRIAQAPTPDDAQRELAIYREKLRADNETRLARAQSFELRAEAVLPYVRLFVAALAGIYLVSEGMLFLGAALIGLGVSPESAKYFLRALRKLPGNGG